MNEALWKRVEAALDARLDPREVPDIATALASAPDAARAVERLAVRLEHLRDARVPGHPRPRSRRRVARLATAAALLGLCASLYLAWNAATPSTPLRAPAEFLETVSLRIEHTSPPPVRGERVVLHPRNVVQWTLEGETP